MFNHAFGLLTHPGDQWGRLAELPAPSMRNMAVFPAIMAILPAVAWYYGTTRIGWTVGDGEPIRLTEDSALALILLFYFTMVTSVAVIGYAIHWMSRTYGANSSLAKGLAIAGFTATPLFITGAVGFYPILWLDMLIGVVAVCWSVYLMYLGIPIVMKIPEERGFLFSSAVLAICLVIMVCILVGSVILWDFGYAPAFTDA
ncbi:MAG: Yip1 family protein [Pseudomonadota bacterium]